MSLADAGVVSRLPGLAALPRQWCQGWRIMDAPAEPEPEEAGTMSQPEVGDQSSPAVVTFMTTEHFVLQTARAAGITETNGRAGFCLAAVSSGLIALALIGQLSRLGTAFYVLGLVLLPTLAFVGVTTFERALAKRAGRCPAGRADQPHPPVLLRGRAPGGPVPLAAQPGQPGSHRPAGGGVQPVLVSVPDHRRGAGRRQQRADWRRDRLGRPGRCRGRWRRRRQ